MSTARQKSPDGYKHMTDLAKMDEMCSILVESQ